MACIYAYYKEEDSYFPRLYCNADDGFCIGAKRCNKEERFVPNERFNEKECFKFIMAEQKKYS